MNQNDKYLPVTMTVRAWTELKTEPSLTKSNRTFAEGWRSSEIKDYTLVFDTETTTDAYQNMTFGCCRLYKQDKLLFESIIMGECLADAQMQLIQSYCCTKGVPCITREQFVENVFMEYVWKLGAVCVGFNLPFDLSRIAIKAAKGRKRHKGAFTFFLSTNPYLPRVRVESINSKAAFISLAAPKTMSGRQGGGRKLFKGRFLDLRTLAFALTNESHSLDSACRMFSVEHGKQSVEEHGIITDEYIDYCRRDVLATYELYEKLMDEFHQHPVDLEPTKAYSPASIGKSYLRTMGVRSLLAKQPDFSRDILGYAMASYYGGRAECHVRKQVAPVTYLDVLSMYPTVFTLQGLWKWVTTEHLQVIEATDEVRVWIESVTLEDLFQKSTWADIPGLVQVIPDNDIFPVRAKYVEGGDYQIGVNVLTSKEPVWYTLADVIASKLLAGKVPHIVRAIRIVPEGADESLSTISLRNAIPIDPTTDDFFRKVIEERKVVQKKKKNASDSVKRDRLDALQRFLKVLANSASYGIFAEFNRQDGDEENPVTFDVYGLKTYESKSVSYEQPGSFANPLLATVITGSARLILAMIERCAKDGGTTYTFCDTDSMAIVGEDVMIADNIAKRFESLCPYTFGGSILKVEDENFNEKTGERKLLYCYGISAKRYALFNLDEGGIPTIRKYTEHGLGHLLSPTQGMKKNAKWIEELWTFIVKQALQLSVVAPKWLDYPALSRLAMTRPSLWTPFKKTKVSYNGSIKPFNFMMVAFPKMGAYTEGKCKKHDEIRIGCPEPYMPCKHRAKCPLTKPIRPVAPFERDATKWSRLPWMDLKTGTTVRMMFDSMQDTLAGYFSVQTYRGVLQQFLIHPESKAAGTDGLPCGMNTTGELQRLHINATGVVHIGKEANRIEEVQTLGIENDTYIEYEEKWNTLREQLKEFPKTQIAKISGLSRREVQYLLNGEKAPHTQTLPILSQTRRFLANGGYDNA